MLGKCWQMYHVYINYSPWVPVEFTPRFWPSFVSPHALSSPRTSQPTRHAPPAASGATSTGRGAGLLGGAIGRTSGPGADLLNQHRPRLGGVGRVFPGPRLGASSRGVRSLRRVLAVVTMYTVLLKKKKAAVLQHQCAGRPCDGVI